MESLEDDVGRKVFNQDEQLLHSLGCRGQFRNRICGNPEKQGNTDGFICSLGGRSKLQGDRCLK